MIDSIYLALTGLRGYQRGLKTIANNTANLNTPGFKGSTLLFADMYASGGGLGGPGAGSQGLGLNTLGTMLSFQPGQLQSTDNGLDLAVDGAGLFVLRDAAGRIRYTRDGQFKFGADGVLVTQVGEEQVMALDDAGALVPITLADLRTNAGARSAQLSFSGNLPATPENSTANNITVFDQAGVPHQLSLQFHRNADGTYTVSAQEGTAAAVAATGQLQFIGGVIDPAHGSVTLRYPLGAAADDAAAWDMQLNFTPNLTLQSSGTTVNLTVTSQDGHVPGSLTGTAFDANGTLQLSYSNGQTTHGARLALARFDSVDAVRAVGDNRFEAADPRGWVTGRAGNDGFGNLKSSMVEMSNVDLSSQFSDLVIMQRGYQASSQIVSTANEMLAELYGMKSK